MGRDHEPVANERRDFVWVAVDRPCGERLRGDSEDSIVEAGDGGTSPSGIRDMADLYVEREHILFMAREFWMPTAHAEGATSVAEAKVGRFTAPWRHGSKNFRSAVLRPLEGDVGAGVLICNVVPGDEVMLTPVVLEMPSLR